MPKPLSTLWVTLRCAAYFSLALTLTQPIHAANDKGLFYRAQRGNAEIYLLGSLHVASPDLYPLRTAMETAFNGADTLAVELDITQIDPAEIATWMAQHGLYAEGDSLRNHLQPQTWQRLSKYLRDQGIDPAAIERQKPGLLVTMLSMQQMNADGLQAELGIDQHFLNAASSTHKPVLELETAAEQLALLADMPNPDQTINATLDEIDNVTPYIDELLGAWKMGDAEKFEPLIMSAMTGDDAESRAYFSRILQQRNHSMVTRLLARSHSVKLFVVVGAAHLVGGEGLPALLKQAGFTVEQI